MRSRASIFPPSLQSFEINKKNENPTTCGVRLVTGFLNAKNSRPAEIHGQIVEVYSEGAVNRGSVRKWCRLFKESRTNVPEEERSVRTNTKSRKFVTIVHTGPTMHQLTVTCFST